ncbi:hypothetical protein FHV99_004634 [Ochrobactrum sp. P20RRXII]|nr:hypothetical protein [Ochrobactrum sp. P20RRXII]
MNCHRTRQGSLGENNQSVELAMLDDRQRKAFERGNRLIAHDPHFTLLEDAFLHGADVRGAVLINEQSRQSLLLFVTCYVNECLYT